MYVIAIIADILSLIPGLNMVSFFVMGGLLVVVGEMTGLRIFTNKRAGTTLLISIAELVPLISTIVPGFTYRVYLAKQDQKAEAGGA